MFSCRDAITKEKRQPCLVFPLVSCQFFEPKCPKDWTVKAQNKQPYNYTKVFSEQTAHRGKIKL